MLWGPIDPIGTIRMGKGWAYGPIPSPRIMTISEPLSEVTRNHHNPLIQHIKGTLQQRDGQIPDKGYG